METSTLGFELKYIIIGDAGVGKSNILLRYTQNKFQEGYAMTVGVDYGSQNITLDDVQYRLQIWDTAGSERFRSITRAFYSNTCVALIVYDITNISSFENVEQWIEDCKSCTTNVTFVLIGNKCDLEDKRVVTTEKGRECAEKNEMLFFETSAKDDINIQEIFLKSVDIIDKRLRDKKFNLDGSDIGIKTNAFALKKKEVDESYYNYYCGSC